MKKGKLWKNVALFTSVMLLATGCGGGKASTPDDYATNKGYESEDDKSSGEGGIAKGISRSEFYIFLILVKEVDTPTHMT